MIVKDPKTLILRQWPALLALLLICGLGFVTTSKASAETDAATPERTPSPEALSKVISSLVSGNRDSMMNEIKRYTLEIAALRDSLTLAGESVEIDESQRQRFESSIEDISLVIGEITEELSHLEFQISDNMISLLDESGEGIVINIPENLDEQVKEGIESLTRIVLAQLPDTAAVDLGMDWNWFSDQSESREIQRQISHGNVVKVWDDLVIDEDEDVRGNVIVVLGDTRIEGRIEGDVTVIMGDLELTPGSEIQGNVVMILGRVMEDGESVHGNLTIVDPLGAGHGFSLASISENGGLVFLIIQGLFILVVGIVLLGMAILPESRVLSVRAAILTEPASSLGVGFVVAMLGHLVVLLLMAMLVLTVIGIPLALLFALAMGIIWVVGTGAVALVLGEKITALLGIKAPNGWISVLTGMVALHLVSFLGAGLGALPGLSGLGSVLILLGIIIKTIAYLFGLGALLTSRLGTKTPQTI